MLIYHRYDTRSDSWYQLETIGGVKVQRFRPDISLYLEDLPLCHIEIKSPGVHSSALLEFDALKLFNCMKQSCDDLIKASVEDGIVIGAYVQGIAACVYPLCRLY